MPWDDNLDDFERQLAADKAQRDNREEKRDRSHEHNEHRSRHHHHRHRDHSSGDRSHGRERDEGRDRHRHKRRRHSRSRRSAEPESQHGDSVPPPPDGNIDATEARSNIDSGLTSSVKRDAWMEAPSALDIDYIVKQANDPIQSKRAQSPKREFERKVHEAELSKHHIQVTTDDPEPIDTLQQPAKHEVDYDIGDSGSKWRMMKLKNVYREAAESGLDVEDVAIKQYGSLRNFDDAREEENELERREMYGTGYVGKIKPDGEYFRSRKAEAAVRETPNSRKSVSVEDDPSDVQRNTTTPTPNDMVVSMSTQPSKLDPTALNRLRAQLMKARLKNLPEVAKLEAEYEQAQAQQEMQAIATNDTVLLGTMENRMLAGGRRAEVKDASKRRARERGQVEDNEDMSIDDMVREERRTKGIFGNEDKRFASRIAKDGKYANDLDYMDDNATKLAKRVHQSDSALRSAAIAQHKSTSSTLSKCPLCHHEDRPSDPLPTAPVVSLGHRSYLTIATTPEISPHGGGASIVPLIHHDNLLQCDDDEWEEIRNFMKSLTRLYYYKKLGVLFYENAAHPRKHRHAALVAVPVPLHLAEDAPAFFREAILASDDEWSQHRKIVDTRGKGKTGFRRSIAKEAPYFHVWTELDGGLGHVVEDERRWPQGDLFAREVLGGMLRVKAETWRRQGRWERDGETAARVERFRKSWDQFDWTKVLVETG